jgi:recombination protein RecA
VRLGDKVNVALPSINTGLPTLDYGIIGTGGIPRGRLIELFGPESSGKTTLALHIIGCEQNNGGICAYVDAEHALDPTYAHKLGVNVDDLVVSQPDSGEDALDTVEALVESQAVTLIIVDSVAALVPRAELEGDMGDSHMGLQARLMSQACRKLTGICAKNQVTVIFINQIREKIGVMFGSPETTTGGRALKFYASVRLDTRRREVIKDGENVIGHEIRIKAVKNKVGTPLKETTISLIYETGFDTTKNLIEYAVNLEVINQAGAWYRFQGANIGQGLPKTIETLKLRKSLMKRVMQEIDKALKAQKEKASGS